MAFQQSVGRSWDPAPAGAASKRTRETRASANARAEPVAPAPAQPPVPAPAEWTRRGNWWGPEKAYVDCLVALFKAGKVPSGLYPSVVGATARPFLAKELRCDPGRLSQKFPGDKALPKGIYQRRGECAPGDVDELRRLRAAFQQSVGRSWDPAPAGAAAPKRNLGNPGSKRTREAPAPADAPEPRRTWMHTHHHGAGRHAVGALADPRSPGRAREEAKKRGPPTRASPARGAGAQKAPRRAPRPRVPWSPPG